MKKIFIKSIGKTIEIDNGVYQVIIENSNIYRNIAINIESEIVLSKDDKLLSIDKEIAVIYDPFNIDLNDPKTIKSLYKLLEKEPESRALEVLKYQLNRYEHILRDDSV